MSETRFFIDDTAFGPDAVVIMGEAFDRAYAASAPRGAAAQEALAVHIIALAKAGERDPQVLCNRALEALARSPERSTA